MSAFNCVFEAEDFDQLVEDKLSEIVLSFQFTLQNALEEKDLSKGELAEKMDVSAARVSQLLGEGNSNFTLKSFVKAAVAMELDLEVVDKNKYLTLIENSKARRQGKGFAFLPSQSARWKEAEFKQMAV